MSTIRLPTRRAHWRRVVFNPITIKELRSTFRQRRFLIVYWVSLAVYSLIVLWLAAVEVGQGNASAEGPVGQRLFNYCVAAQLALMLFVLPGFAAAAITDERENQSFDLLVTTALRAFDIVWGKFLACMSYAFLFLAATFPLVCVSVLFTGVRPGEILFAYGLMSMVAVLMVATGLACSSIGRSSRRSVAVTYALSLLTCVGCSSIAYWLKNSMPASYSKMNLVGYYYDLVFHEGLSSTVWTAVVPLVIWGITTALLLIVAVDRLKPTTANKSTNLRIVGLVAAATISGAVAVQFLVTSAPIEQRAGNGLTTLILEAVVLAVYLVGAACEDPRISRRIQWQYQWASGWKWPLRLILPGSASGLIYVLVVAVLLLGGTVWVLSKSVSNPPASESAATTAARVATLQSTVLWTGVLLGAMVWCFAAFARWCSTVFAGAIYTRTVVIFVFVMANLVPVCLMTLGDQSVLGTGTSQSEQASTLWNMHYASSFLSLRSAWHMTGYWPLPDRGIFRSKLLVATWHINQPVAVVSTVFHLALALVFTLHGAWRQQRIIRKELKVLYANQRLPSITSSELLQGGGDVITSQGQP
jgi:ABC-type transport system involved in multi-copper enzyme maturation permease subunit